MKLQISQKIVSYECEHVFVNFSYILFENHIDTFELGILLGYISCKLRFAFIFVIHIVGFYVIREHTPGPMLRSKVSAVYFYLRSVKKHNSLSTNIIYKGVCVQNNLTARVQVLQISVR